MAGTKKSSGKAAPKAAAAKAPAKKAPAKKAPAKETKAAETEYKTTSFRIFKGELLRDLKTEKDFKLNMNLDLGKGEKFYDISLPNGQWRQSKKTAQPTIYIDNDAKLKAQHILSKQDKDAGITKADKAFNVTPLQVREAVLDRAAKAKEARAAKKVDEPTAQASDEKGLEKD